MTVPGEEEEEDEEEEWTREGRGMGARFFFTMVLRFIVAVHAHVRVSQ